MSTINDGGAAFPSDPFVDHPAHGRVLRASIGEEGEPGMTLRDYLAAKAIPAYLAHLSCGGTEMVSRGYAEIAAESYQLADAMLAERAKGR